MNISFFQPWQCFWLQLAPTIPNIVYNYEYYGLCPVQDPQTIQMNCVAVVGVNNTGCAALAPVQPE